MDPQTTYTKMDQTLEQLVDTHGLEEILGVLACICSEKAEHIRDTHSDSAPLAVKAWEQASSYVEQTAVKVKGLGNEIRSNIQDQARHSP